MLEPRFTLHGFRYAEITGYPGDLDPADVVARVVHSDIAARRVAHRSADWLERLARSIDWGQRGNFISVPTDCPQRDERLGWLGDAQVFARTACYNRDVAAFFGKWLVDVADAQLPSGAFSDIAPTAQHRRGRARRAGPTAGSSCPGRSGRCTATRGVLERHLGAMTAWMDYLERANPDYLRVTRAGQQLQRLAHPRPRRHPARAARHRVLGL